MSKALPTTNPHPVELLARFGVTEAPAAAAIGIVAVLQYVFLIRLWLGYLIQGSGDVIHPNVVVTGAALSIAGALVIGAWSVCAWRRGDVASARLEHPASDVSFAPLRDMLRRLVARSTLAHSRATTLIYTQKNAQALEARELKCGAGAVVVGLGQRREIRIDPEALAAKIGHEVSHLELAGTRIERAARRLTFLHLRILGWIALTFALALGFIDRRGIGSNTAFGGFEPIFEIGLYRQLSSHFVVLAYTAVLAFVYAYFFAVRREHGHDYRGCQLAANDALAERVFVPKERTMPRRLFESIRDFTGLHPTQNDRQQALRRRDILLLSAIVYPAIIGAIQPLSLLLMAGWRSAFGVEQHIWNSMLTPAAGLLLFLVLRADIARLGLGLVLHFWRYVARVPLYALIAGVAGQIPRFVLEVLYGFRIGRPLEEILQRFWAGFLSGGGRIALLYAAVLIALAYLAAVRAAATGEHRAGRFAWFDRFAGAIIAVGGFTVASLASAEFIGAILIVVGCVAVLCLSLHTSQRCEACGSIWRADALWLRSCCACGHEHLLLLRRWQEEPFAKHLPVK